MFEEVKEMIDSTIYENGRGEITAQNINLAMHGVIGAVEDKVTELEQSAGNGGSGALRWWLAHESFGIVNTPEQTAENIATYNKLVEDKYASVILCYGADMGSISTYTSAPVVVQHAIIGGETQMILSASITVEEGYPMECITVMPNPDGTMEVLTWQQTSDSSGPLRVWVNEENTPEQVAENVATYTALKNNKAQQVYFVLTPIIDPDTLEAVVYTSYSVETIQRADSDNGFYLTKRFITDNDGTVGVFTFIVLLFEDGTLEYNEDL